MPYFKPTTDFNMLQYIISDTQEGNSIQVSIHYVELLAVLLVNVNSLIILERSKHVMHAIV